MGVIVAMTVGFGILFVRLAPARILTRTDLSACYAPPPVSLPCDRLVYVGGVLDAAFTALCGLMLVGVAGWTLCELWQAVEPAPITDDFLRLLNDSFGRDWRNPLKWPWARLLYAYAFACVGAVMTAVIAAALWTAVAASAPPKRPVITHVETSQDYRLQ
jgi:hypothetical protein